jgi:cyclopropane-fatty-acyl-phospholipid synthase
MSSAEWFERWPIPDWALRTGIARICAASAAEQARIGTGNEAVFAKLMAAKPIALHPDSANSQHYQLPPDFFALALGPVRKYSCCYYPTGKETLAEAEQAALAETMVHAALADGQTILELGCGWGSLTLAIARAFPEARIVAVSNAAEQRAHIESRLAAEGLDNVMVVTADMNDFVPGAQFDRVVSVEMFEHMANWRSLLTRISDWLTPEGQLFIHIFTHRTTSYLYDHTDPDNWMARHFFTGGIMPGRGLIGEFDDLFTVAVEWTWPGTHYAQTARHWLANFDANRDANRAILRAVYGADWQIWERRWRLFYLAVEIMFGHDGGSHWGVSHYRLTRASGSLG